MKITGLHTSGFGVLKEWSLEDLSSNALIFFGPNESGKTTTFCLIQCLLYGFSPADSAKHPFTPWDGTPLSLSGDFVLDDGTRVFIHRRLRSRPEGVLKKVSGGQGSAESLEQLANREAYFIKHISRAVFDQVYALTLDDLNMPDDRIWGELQDHLVGSFTPGFLRPARAVIAELGDEASKLWKADARGKPKDKILAGRIRDLHGLRKEARDRDEAVRGNIERIEILDEEISVLKEQKIKAETALRFANRLNPVKKKHERIEELRRHASQVECYDDLPDDPMQKIAELEDEAANLLDTSKRLEEERVVLENKVSSFTPKDEVVLSYATRIREWARRLEHLLNESGRLRDLGLKAEQANKNAKSTARNFIAGEWSDAIAEKIRSIPMDRLRILLSEFSDSDEQHKQITAKIEGIKAKTIFAKPRISLWANIVSLLIGLGAMIFGGIKGYDILILSGLAITVFVAAQWWSGHKMNQAVLAQERERDDAISKANLAREGIWTERKTTEDRLRALFKGIPLIEEYYRKPVEGLITEISNIQRDLEELAGYRHQYELIRGQLLECSREIEKMASACGAGAISPEDHDEGRFANLPNLITDTETLLADSMSRQEDARKANERLVDLNEEIEDIQRKTEAVESERESIIESLEAAGQGDRMRGATIIEEKRRARRDAIALWEDLQRDYPDLEDILTEIGTLERSEGQRVFSDEEIVRIQNELEDIRDTILEKEKEQVALSKDVETLLSQPTLDFIEGEIEALEEERAEARLCRDRLMLLRAFLIQSDIRYREEHQPDIFKRASKYLDVITDGRYHRISVDEGEEGQTLFLHPSQEDFPLKVAPPLSRGTLDQIYLALRLALVGHLDSGKERFPVFLDEVLVNWDGIRRARGVEVLKEIAKERQVFLFTCHDTIADRLVEELNGIRIDLSGPSNVRK
jgi:uncharacterized protein YhaN